MYRTDLAYEAHEGLAKNCDGVILETKNLKYGELVKIEITDEEAQKVVGKKIGKYVTYETPSFKHMDKDKRQEIIETLSSNLKEIIDIDREHILVVGLGNRRVTADSLGPRTIDKIKVTRQFFKAYKKDFDDDYNELAILVPGVMGVTGIETQNTIKGVIEKIKPTLIIAIDALASRKMKRLCSVIQLTNAGIEPGSGIGNMQGSLNKESMGIKIAAIGVPTVVDTATIVSDSIDLMKEKFTHKISVADEVLGLLGQLDENEKLGFIKEVLNPKYNDTYVTPTEIDELIEILSDVLSEVINVAVHPGFYSNEF
ncbi:GPR endopeptidase [Sedimentibacter sp. zth1]|uniref:GPR endopeptidase n=1 Tax=Sedimentibacter sp. zth1 TaxID=2816908 RepID=UPI001A92866C|nr:GPR endopeptidase [Sedimentibacter sp. zth1]QSX07093.1 GPR endopeptidase [Sedimentibacter sp. zth1]